MALFFVLAVLHCSLKKPAKVIALGQRLVNYLYVNTTLFATPPIALLDFKAQLKKASDAQDAMADRRTADVQLRDDEVLALLFMIYKLMFYVNGLYLGEAGNLKASGFDINKLAEPHQIPLQQRIKKVEGWREDNSAKIYLEKIEAETDLDKKSQWYVVQMAIGSKEEDKFEDVLTIKSSTSLIIKNLKRGVEVFFRVAAANSKGRGVWSDPKPFIPQR